MQKRNGKYIVQIRIEGKVKTFTFSKYRDAMKKESTLRDERELIRAGLEVPKDSVLLLDHAGRWLNGLAREVSVGEMAQATLDSYEVHVRKYIGPKFGQRPLPFIKSEDVKTFLDETQDQNGFTNAYRNRIRATLHILFKDAFMKGLIASNPAARSELLKENPKRKEPLDLAAADRLIAAATARGPMAELAMLLMVYEGRRVSEVVGLQHRDFDLKNREIAVRRIWEQCTGTVRDGIKGKRDGLVIPMFDRVRDAYLRWVKVTEFGAPTDHVICRESGQPMSTHLGKDMVYAAAKDAGINGVHAHLCRATFATLAEEAGYSKEDIQRMLGHSSVQTTQIYTRRSARPLLEKGDRLGFGTTAKKARRKRG